MPPGGSSGGPDAPVALIDTHVHFHDCYELAPFLDAAARNLEAVDRELDLSGGREGSSSSTRLLLLVMETGGGTLISRLDAASARLAGEGWRVEATEEAGSRRLVGEHRAPLTVVEGRQVVTSERLELLAAPCAVDVPDGLPLAETIEAAERHGAVPILPWGFGKWTGRRGRVVAALLESWSPGRVLLADNGGRLRPSWKPRLLTLGAQRGFVVVRGSDPLPLASDARRVGSSGSVFRGELDPARPAASVRTLLRGLRQPPRSFGRGVGPITFLGNQIYMQLRRGRA